MAAIRRRRTDHDFLCDPNACDGTRLPDGQGQRHVQVLGGAKEAPTTCEARTGGQPVQFAQMGNAADLCPNPVVPEGYGDFRRQSKR